MTDLVALDTWCQVGVSRGSDASCSSGFSLDGAVEQLDGCQAHDRGQDATQGCV